MVVVRGAGKAAGDSMIRRLAAPLVTVLLVCARLEPFSNKSFGPLLSNVPDGPNETRPSRL
jgi:hypothetical protein